MASIHFLPLIWGRVALPAGLAGRSRAPSLQKGSIPPPGRGPRRTPQSSYSGQGIPAPWWLIHQSLLSRSLSGSSTGSTLPWVIILGGFFNNTLSSCQRHTNPNPPPPRWQLTSVPKMAFEIKNSSLNYQNTDQRFYFTLFFKVIPGKTGIIFYCYPVLFCFLPSSYSCVVHICFQANQRLQAK